MNTRHKHHLFNSLPAALGALALLALPAAAATKRLELFSNGENQAPLVFEAGLQTEVVETGNGVAMVGDVTMITPLGPIQLVGANLLFGFAEGTRRIETVRGLSYVPSPFVSKSVEISKPAVAEFGLDYGKNLESLGVPLQYERRYLYFAFNAGLEMLIGTGGDEGDTKPFKLSIPAGAEAKLILDPLDPFYYFSGAFVTPEGSKDGNDGNGGGDAGGDSDGGSSGDSNGKTDRSGPQSNDMNGKNPDKQSQDGQDGNANNNESGKDEDDEDDSDAGFGEGRSFNGYIPFRPQTVEGIEDAAAEFTGHKILSGEFPIPNTPLKVSGYAVQHVRVLDELRPLGLLGLDFGFVDKIGINGELSVSWEFLKVSGLGNVAEFGFDLGKATAAVEFDEDTQHIYFSGVIDPDTTWIPEFIPIVPKANLVTYGYIGPKGSRFHASGRYALDASNIGKLTGLDIRELMYVEGVLNVDRRGFLLSGTTGTGFGPIGYQSERTVTAWIPFEEGAPAYLELSGFLEVPGLRADGVARASVEGIALTGKLVGTDWDWKVAGEIQATPAGPRIKGAFSVPEQLNPDLRGELKAAAKTAQDEVSRVWDEYEDATKDYEFELSLRGVRKAIPGVVNAINDGIDDGINAAFKKWPKLVPGKSAALKEARKDAQPYKDRLNRLKSLAAQGDSASLRAALKSAINDVLSHQRVTIKVPVLGTVYSRDVISGSTESKLRTALAAIDRLPETSDRKVKAQKIWEQAPKHEVLTEIGKAIESGQGAVPRIVAISFDRLLYGAGFTVAVDIEYAGKRVRVEVGFDPANPAAIGRAAGQAWAATL